MSRLQNLGCVLWGIACGVSAAGAQALPTPSAPAVARVNASSASVPATGSLLITIKELDATTAADATLLTEPTDVVGASTTPPTVTFDRPLALPTTGSQRNWVLPFRVAGMPAGAELTRYFSFKLGTADLDPGLPAIEPGGGGHQLGPKADPSASAGNSAGRAAAAERDHRRSVPVTGIRVAPVVLVEQGSKRTLAASQLTLCQTPAPCKGEPFNLEGNGSHEVWLAPRSNKDGKAVSTLSPGKYDGAVTLSSSDKPGGESVNVTVHVTSWCWQVTGFVLIVIGVGAAWFFTTFLRHRLGRDQMRLTAMVLRGSVDKIARTLGALKPAVNAPEIEARLDKLEVALSDQSLQSQGLPPPSPLPWSGTNALTNADTFKKHIEAQMSWINALQAIVNDGIVRLVKP